ncbi:MAG: glycosyltransferase family 2 protein [Acidobacteria bacterium]|nr:glycosyltransferase family 2 protein [Acidobacteriota bacterium]
MPATVAVPTIGRPALLAGLLESLAACRPRAAEILVVDQGHQEAVGRVVERFAGAGARLVSCDGVGVGRARNLGLREAAHDAVLCTDDDCAVAKDWVGRAWEHVRADPGRIVTGRVLPRGAGGRAPSLRDDPAPREYAGKVRSSVLSAGNMALSRSRVLALGGFDERLPALEDHDLCYRWLRAGHRLGYEPDLVVWHREWRTPEQLRDRYVVYGRGHGMFYAKHLRGGDLRVLRLLARDAVQVFGGIAGGLARGGPVLKPWRRGMLIGLPSGLRAGWRVFDGSAGGAPRGPLR